MLPSRSGQSTSHRLLGIPKLAVSTRNRKPPTGQGSTKKSEFCYIPTAHCKLPHVVKFSGGRSSGMLLFTLLENKILDPQRGDVIIFNNTSAEHPNTYRFVRECTKASSHYGIPFFWIEFQTYEDSRSGEWTRLPTYRLVNDQPKSDQNPDGFHWRGEVFEELLSWSGYVPNQFSRGCTQQLKIETTRLFLKDWLLCKEAIPRIGHFGSESRMSENAVYRRHRSNGGTVPKEILLRKRAFVLSRPHVRNEQRYEDFSLGWQPLTNGALSRSDSERGGWLHEDGVEYISLVGLRGDEEKRVQRVEARNETGAASGKGGEYVYMPLAEMGKRRGDVNSFWEKQNWHLELPEDGCLSNCVYCFLKGANRLRNIRQRMEGQMHVEDDEFGSLLGTPSDIEWWTRMEQLYGRDLNAEKKKIRGNSENSFVGFFGVSKKFSYELLGQSNGSEVPQDTGRPSDCVCTE